MLKIWGRASSSNVQKVLWAAAELELPFERIDIGGPFGRTGEPFYRAMNPNGLVPTIEDDDFVLWESNTICRYLAARQQAETLYPSGLRARADVERWMDWSSTALGPALFAAFWGLIRTPPEQRDLTSIVGSGEKTAAALMILDDRLANHRCLCGNDLTLADIAVGSHVYRWLNMDFASAGFDRPRIGHLERWYANMTERPAFRQWVMIPIV